MRGNSFYQIEYLPEVIKKDIPQLPKKAKTLVQKAIEERLLIDPIGFGKPLRYSLKGHRRLRVGDYRVIYRIDALNQLVVIIAIRHRKNIYAD